MTPPAAPQPPPLAAHLLSVEQMQAVERRADAAGHPYSAMMDRAGAAVAALILHEFGARPTLVLAGPGNNGGDGLVCARLLHRAGAPVRVLLCKRNAQPAPGTDPHLESLVAIGVEVEAFAEGQEGHAWLPWAEVLVDALLGTGANRPLSGAVAALLAAARTVQESPAAHTRRPLAIIAVDCPSGLNCDDGSLDPRALHADATVTFAFAKWGHYRFPGALSCGRLHIADIGIPDAIAEEVVGGLPERTFMLDAATVASWLPARPAVSHKGSFGKALVVAGSVPYPGALALACRAAGRVGAGLVTGAVAEPVWPVAAARLTEPTWLPLPAHDGALDGSAAPLVREAAARHDALLIGCGLSQQPGVLSFVRALLQPESVPLPPLLIDADGLNLLAKTDGWPERLRRATSSAILTPHPAELGRLLNLPVDEVMARRWELARAAAVRWGVYLLVKGPFTVIADPAGTLAVLPVATPALATAGTGDVLAGAIVGLLAQGNRPFQAACAGAWLHGQAGLLCARRFGEAGALALDVADELPSALRRLQRAQP